MDHQQKDETAVAYLATAMNTKLARARGEGIAPRQCLAQIEEPAGKFTQPLYAWAAPAAVAGPNRDEIAALRAEHGITSTGRGIKEFEQVDAFVRAVLQRWGAAPALEAPAHQCCNSWFLSLPEGRQAVLRENQWMLADAAYQAGRESRSALEAPAAPESVRESDVRDMIGMVESGQAEEHHLLQFLQRLVPDRPVTLAAAPQAPAAPVGQYTLVDEGLPVELAGAQAQYSIERADGSTAAWILGDGSAVAELMAALRMPVSGANAAAPAAPAVDAGALRDAEHYRFIKRHRLILSGGTEKYGWPIAPFGDECDRYIAKELAAEREAQAKEGGA